MAYYDSGGTNGHGFSACFNGCDQRPGCTGFTFSGTVSGPTTGAGTCYYRMAQGTYFSSSTVYGAATLISNGTPQLPCPYYNGTTFSNSDGSVWQIYCGYDSSNSSPNGGNGGGMASCMTQCSGQNGCTMFTYNYGGAEPANPSANADGTCYFKYTNSYTLSSSPRIAVAVRISSASIVSATTSTSTSSPSMVSLSSAASGTASNLAVVTTTSTSTSTNAATSTSSAASQACTGTMSPNTLPTDCTGSRAGSGLVGTFTDPCGSQYTLYCGNDTSPGASSSASASSLAQCMQACDNYANCRAATFAGGSPGTCYLKNAYSGLISTGQPNLAALVKYIPAPASYQAPPAAGSVNTSSGCGVPLTSGLYPSGPSVVFNAINPSDGLQRNWTIHIPQNYSVNAAAPLILAFPGHGESFLNIEAETGFSDAGNNPYSVVAYVNGYGYGFESNPDYQLGHVYSYVDDLGFIKWLIQNLTSSYCIDTGRILATGFSNGAGFVNVLACDPVLSNTIAVFAPHSVAAYPNITSGNPATEEPLNTLVQSVCSPGRNNVPMIEFHGTGDGTISYYGGGHNGYSMPTIPHWVTDWSLRQGYSGNNVSSTMAPLAAATGTPGINIYRWGGDQGQYGLITHYQIANWGHEWSNPVNDPNSPLNAAPIIMDFFYRFTNPNRPPTYNPVSSSSSTSMSSTSTVSSNTVSSSAGMTSSTPTISSSTVSSSSTSLSTASSSSPSSSTMTSSTASSSVSSNSAGTQSGSSSSISVSSTSARFTMFGASSSATTSTTSSPAAASSSSPPVCQNNTMYTDTNGAVYNIFCSADTSGSNPFAGPTINPGYFTDCMALCDNTANCAVFTWVPQGGTGGVCYMKAAPQRLVNLPNYNYVAAFLVSGGGSSSSSVSTSATVFTSSSTASSATMITTGSPSSITSTSTAGGSSSTSSSTASSGVSSTSGIAAPTTSTSVTGIPASSTSVLSNTSSSAINQSSSSVTLTMNGASSSSGTSSSCSSSVTVTVTPPSSSTVTITVSASSTPISSGSSSSPTGGISSSGSPSFGAFPTSSPNGGSSSASTTSTSSSAAASSSAASLQCPAANGTTYSDLSGNQYVILCNIDTNPSAFGGTNEPSFPACVNSCASYSNPSCVAVTYLGGTCYYKSAYASSKSGPGANSAVLLSAFNAASNSGSSSSSSVSSAAGSTSVASTASTPSSSAPSSTVLSSGTAAGNPSSILTSSSVPLGSTAFGLSSMVMSSTSSSAAASSSAATVSCPASNGTTYTDSSGSQYVILCDFDTSPNSYGSLAVSDLPSCISACSARGSASPACVAATFFGGVCYFKSAYSYAFTSSGRQTAILLSAYAPSGSSASSGMSSSTMSSMMASQSSTSATSSAAAPPPPYGGSSPVSSYASSSMAAGSSMMMTSSSIAVPPPYGASSTVASVTSIDTSIAQTSGTVSSILGGTQSSLPPGTASASSSILLVPGSSSFAASSGSTLAASATSIPSATAGMQSNSPASISSLASGSTTGMQVVSSSATVPGASPSSQVTLGNSAPVSQSTYNTPILSSLSASMGAQSSSSPASPPRPYGGSSSLQSSATASGSDSSSTPSVIISAPPAQSTSPSSTVVWSSSSSSTLPACPSQTCGSQTNSTACADQYGNSFNVTCNTQYQGTISMRAAKANLNACLLACDTSSSCVAVNYFSSGECDLFSQVTGNVTVPGAGAEAASRPPDVTTVYSTPPPSTMPASASTVTGSATIGGGPGPVTGGSISGVVPYSSTTIAGSLGSTAPGSSYVETSFAYSPASSSSMTLISLYNNPSGSPSSPMLSSSMSNGGQGGMSAMMTSAIAEASSSPYVTMDNPYYTPSSSAAGGASSFAQGASSGVTYAAPSGYNGASTSMMTMSSPYYTPSSSGSASTNGGVPSPSNAGSDSSTPSDYGSMSSNTLYGSMTTDSATASSPVTTSTSSPICPAYNNQTYTDPQGSSYQVQCNTAYQGTVINSDSDSHKLLKARQQGYSKPTNPLTCMLTCDQTPSCIAIVLTDFQCTLYSAVSGSSAVQGATALLKVATPIVVTVTVSVCNAQGARDMGWGTTTVFTTATLTTCAAEASCTVGGGRWGLGEGFIGLYEQ